MDLDNIIKVSQVLIHRLLTIDLRVNEFELTALGK